MLYKDYTMTQLTVTSRLIAIKSKYNASENLTNAILSSCKELLPFDNTSLENRCSLKKSVHLGCHMTRILVDA